MKRTALLYAAIGGAAAIAGVGAPLLVHRSGSEAVPGWRGLVNPGPISRSHTFISQQCESCHTPHQGADAQKCVACHAATSFQEKPSTRFHLEAKDCMSCHVEHEGGRAATRMNHAALLEPGLWRSQRTGAPASERRALSDYLTGQLHTERAHVAAGLQCSTCHAIKDPHQRLFGDQCASCHGLESWEVSRFQHPPMTSTQCAECHRPPPSHYMMHFSMVSQRVANKRARVDQCYACHATDSWNNIRGRGAYDHH